jgi:cell division protein FtsN/predicted Ser/Thr protein kinase
MTSMGDPATTKRAETAPWLGEVAGHLRTKHADAPEVDRADVPPSIPARYEILTQVGTGGTGIVYKVRDLETGEIVALKVLKPGIASDPDEQENLRKEVCLARKVTHKNVCRIHEFNRSNGTACLSMEFVEGENLLSKLRRVGRLPVDESLEIARQICAGLREAHAQGIVHRDLKPANIMLDPSGVVKIMDFGIARLSRGNGQMTGTIVGTPAYMAPEQVELKAMGPRTDIYAVGLLLYEMVTGAAAFEGDTMIAVALKQIREFPRRPCEIVPTLPAHTEAVIWKCLQKDPAKRFQSIDELHAALEKETKTRIDVPGWVSVELRVPDLKANRLIHYGMEKAHAAAPRLAAFATEVRRANREADQLAMQGVKKAIAFVRAQDLQLAKITRRSLVAATLGIVFLGTIVAFGLGTRGKSHTTQTAKPSVALALPSTQPPDPKSVPVATGANSEAISPTDAGQDLTTNEVDLGGVSGVPSDVASGTASQEEVSASQAGSSPTVESTAPSPARTSPSPGTIRPLQPAGAHGPQRTRAAPSATHGTANTMNGQKTTDAKVDLPATFLATSLPNPSLTQATPKPTNAVSQHAAGQSAPDSTALYLEVGSFKDASWADKAVDQLSALGFQALCIHKSHLWMQSYHVQVGPFASQTDMEAAQRNLASHDFTSHLVK